MQHLASHRVRSTLIGIALTAVVATACGGGESPSTADTTTSPTTAPSTAGDPVTTSPTTAGTADTTHDTEEAQHTAWRAVSQVPELSVLDRPGGVEVANLAETTVFGTPTVVGVIDDHSVPAAPDAAEGEWVQVLVPERPNDLTGWVRAGDVELEPVDAEIRIDVGQKVLRLFEAGEQTGEWTVAVGRPDRPTPTGRFFITDKLATDDPGGVYGPWAFGLSAYSDVLTDFIGGNGQVGLHGTNDPSSLGNEASSGCIRLPNEVMADLIERLPLGTPVHIV